MIFRASPEILGHLVVLMILMLLKCLFLHCSQHFDCVIMHLPRLNHRFTQLLSSSLLMYTLQAPFTRPHAAVCYMMQHNRQRLNTHASVTVSVLDIHTQQAPYTYVPIYTSTCPIEHYNMQHAPFVPVHTAGPISACPSSRLIYT